MRNAGSVYTFAIPVSFRKPTVSINPLEEKDGARILCHNRNLQEYPVHCN